MEYKSTAVSSVGVVSVIGDESLELPGTYQLTHIHISTISAVDDVFQSKTASKKYKRI